jgi:hypothetical protein
MEALAEFRLACDPWLPQLNECEQNKASQIAPAGSNRRSHGGNEVAEAFGYVSRNKKLFIEEEEAERVRTIFRRYLDLGSIGFLLADLRERGIVPMCSECRPRETSPLRAGHQTACRKLTGVTFT